MVNKKVKVKRTSNVRCVNFINSIEEDNHFKPEAIFLRDCLTYSEFEICKKKQKLDQCENSFAFHRAELDQDEYMSNPSVSQNLNDQRHLKSLSVCLTRENFGSLGNYYHRDPKYAELVRNDMHHDIDFNNELSTFNQLSLHLAAIYNQTKMMEYLLVHWNPNINRTDPNGRTALHVAAFCRNVGAVVLLLKYGANPQAKSHKGLSPMFFAVQSGCTDIVELLANHGCDVNEFIIDRDLNRQYSHLHSAVERNHAQMVESLLRCGANANQHDSYGKTALHLAARDGRLDIARLLLDRGARVHERDRSQHTALLLAVDAGHGTLFRLLLHHGADPSDRGPAGASLIHLAVKHDDLDFLSVLLHRGADVNAATHFGKTALHYAVAEKNWCALKLLLENGADPNRAETLGKTPLHSAIEARRTEAFELLFRHGADANARDAARQTPLHAAVKQGCLSSVRTLLRHGAEVDAVDAAWQTPLHLAAHLGHLELFEPLANHGANVDATDAEGRTALHLAVASEHAKLLYLQPDHTFFARLLSHGADVRGRTHSAGETALHLAVRRRCRAFARGLLRCGAEVDAEDSGRRRTPLHLAAENGDAECAEQLLLFGADPSRLDADGRTALELAVGANMSHVFGRYAIRRKAAGLRMNSSLHGLENEAGSDYTQACVEEASRMAKTRLCEKVTYIGFLRANRRSLVMLVRKPEVREAFEQERQRSIFPLYADMLKRNLDVGVLYEPLLEETRNQLTLLLGAHLPSVPLEHVLSYMDARDMRCFIKATSISLEKINSSIT